MARPETQIDLEKLEASAFLRDTFGQIAMDQGITSPTLREHCRKKPAVRAALDRGRQRAVDAAIRIRDGDKLCALRVQQAIDQILDDEAEKEELYRRELEQWFRENDAKLAEMRNLLERAKRKVAEAADAQRLRAHDANDNRKQQLDRLISARDARAKKINQIFSNEVLKSAKAQRGEV